MADLSDNPSSSHGQAGSTIEAVEVEYREVLGIPDEIGKLVEEFEAESLEMRMKIHRMPASLADMGDQFVIPIAVAIGPYHHGLPHLQGMEKVKRVAAHTLSRDSSKSREDMYALVLAVADKAHHLYGEDAVSSISKDQFAGMMFHDACFLLQYMKLYLGDDDDDEAMHLSPLNHFFLSNEACILNDIMLLENQLPWLVIEALMDAMKVDVDLFIGNMGNSMGHLRLTFDVLDSINLAPSDRPPHLLGLLRVYKQGALVKPPDPYVVFRSSIPVRAMELEGIGIKLEGSQTNKFNNMGISKGLLFDKLFLMPLKLDHTRASWLANMVAFEVCTTSYSSQSTNDSSVCSYVAILAMLMHREDDVHMLRSKGFVHGELSDKQILKFFNGLAQQISPGDRYFQILEDIRNCKRRRWLRIMVCKFVTNNAKGIAAVLSLIGVFVGIFKALFSLKQH